MESTTVINPNASLLNTGHAYTQPQQNTNIHLHILHQQPNTYNNNTNTIDNEEWGDKQTDPQPGTIRIGFQNIGPQRKSSWCFHAKATTNHILKGKYDAFLFVDFGLHFGKVHTEHHWRERMRTIFKDSSSIVAYNINETQLLKSPYQAGGSAMTIGDELNARKIGNGSDPTGLGRWAWSKIMGKSGFTTVLVAAYRPTNNRRDYGSVQTANPYRLLTMTLPILMILLRWLLILPKMPQ